MWVPFIVYWAIVVVGRRRLGVRTVLVADIIWCGLLLGCFALRLSSYAFVVAQIIADVILLLILSKGIARIR